MRENSLRQLIIFLIVVLIACPALLTAQSTNTPISDNGFRIFNFGDSVEQYGSDICIWDPVENIIRYKYCGNDTSMCKIGDIRFDDVVLCFNGENRLFSINFSLYTSQKTALKEFTKLQNVLYEKMLVYLVSMYGRDYENTSDKESVSKTWTKKSMIIKLAMFGGGNNYWCRFGISFRKNFNEADQ